MTDKPLSPLEAAARAICKVELSDTGMYGDEICCQFAPASRRQEGCENDNVEIAGPLRCCQADFSDEAQAAISAYMAAVPGEYDELVERLREYEEWEKTGYVHALFKEAADAITALRAERDHWQMRAEELDIKPGETRPAVSTDLAQVLDEGSRIIGEEKARAEAAEQRCARLEAALEEIANGEGVYGAQAHEYKQIARAALENEDG